MHQNIVSCGRNFFVLLRGECTAAVGVTCVTEFYAAKLKGQADDNCPVRYQLSCLVWELSEKHCVVTSNSIICGDAVGDEESTLYSYPSLKTSINTITHKLGYTILPSLLPHFVRGNYTGKICSNICMFQQHPSLPKAIQMPSLPQCHP